MTLKGNARVSPHAVRGEQPDREFVQAAMARFIGPIHRLSGGPINGPRIDDRGRWVGSPQVVAISQPKAIPAGFYDEFAQADGKPIQRKNVPPPVRRGWLVRAVLELLKGGKPVSVGEMSKKIDHEAKKVGECLCRMAERGLVRRVDLGIYQRSEGV